MENTYTVTLKGINGKIPFHFHTTVTAYTFEGAISSTLEHFTKSIPPSGIEEVNAVLEQRN